MRLIKLNASVECDINFAKTLGVTDGPIAEGIMFKMHPVSENAGKSELQLLDFLYPIPIYDFVSRSLTLYPCEFVLKWKQNPSDFYALYSNKSRTDQPNGISNE